MQEETRKDEECMWTFSVFLILCQMNEWVREKRA